MPEPRLLLIRRVISLSNRGDDLCVGWLEDNFHHLGVALWHRGGQVTQISSRIVRYPWTTCAESGRLLRDLKGMTLRPRASDLAAQHSIREHCTHLFELAALVVAQAASAREDRRYDARIWSAKGERVLCGSLTLNKTLVAAWTVADGAVLQPAAMAGQSLVANFRKRLAALDDEDSERSWIMRRVFWLAEGDMNFVRMQRADEVGLGPVCYTFRTERSCRALAMDTSRIDVNAPDANFLSFAAEIP